MKKIIAFTLTALAGLSLASASVSLNAPGGTLTLHGRFTASVVHYSGLTKGDFSAQYAKEALKTDLNTARIYFHYQLNAYKGVASSFDARLIRGDVSAANPNNAKFDEIRVSISKDGSQFYIGNYDNVRVNLAFDGYTGALSTNDDLNDDSLTYHSANDISSAFEPQELFDGVNSVNYIYSKDGFFGGVGMVSNNNFKVKTGLNAINNIYNVFFDDTRAKNVVAAIVGINKLLENGLLIQGDIGATSFKPAQGTDVFKSTTSYEAAIRLSYRNFQFGFGLFDNGTIENTTTVGKISSNGFNTSIAYTMDKFTIALSYAKFNQKISKFDIAPEDSFNGKYNESLIFLGGAYVIMPEVTVFANVSKVSPNKFSKNVDATDHWSADTRFSAGLQIQF